MTITIDLLMEYAESVHNIPRDVTYKALIELDTNSVEYLFKNLRGKLGIYVSYLCDKAMAAKGDKAFFALVSALNALSGDEVDAVILSTLKNLKDERAIPVLKELLERVKESWNIESVSRTIISLEYDGDYVAALQDESFVLRKYVARKFEAENDNQSLINALSNSAPEVRQIAAWYMGYKKVFTAKEALESQLQQETDSETRRAIEWALSILKIS